MTDWPLLVDMYYAAPDLWYLIGGIVLSLLIILIFQSIEILKIKQKNYFLNRDRERYAETLYASRDGYFAFIYPDQKVNDPRESISERCSRRLAVIMNLPNGTKTTFTEILKHFYKEDALKIQKYVALLQDDGVSFDDHFILKSANKYLHLSGARINGADGNIYCDMIWFRDVSFETSKILSLEKTKTNAETNLVSIQNLLNNIPFPLWLRNDKLEISYYNKAFSEFSNCSMSNDKSEEKPEISNPQGESISKELAKLAVKTNRLKKANVSVVKNGERFAMEVFENPFHGEDTLDKIYTAGILINVNELDELKRNLKIHQNAQLEILETLGTAFAVFDQNLKLAFHNHAFANLWKLDEDWLESSPSYAYFLDTIREKRLLPEVPDYLMFKNEEQKKFSQIIEPQKDMLHLPNGRTLSRMRAAYPTGGLIFAYEDITDRIATTSAYNALLSGQKEMLENLFDAVLIFGTNGRLLFYNQAYIKLWKPQNELLNNEPNLDEILESQRNFFDKKDNWKSLKEKITEHILSVTTKSFVLNGQKNNAIMVSSCNLSDGSLMVTYKEIPNN
ncbi:MAG: PAS-domain containing protein [Alphaproteobacteria bacterium]|nr:PAS-domain containing protein [Alphaproteobacteria bacterium]